MGDNDKGKCEMNDSMRSWQELAVIISSATSGYSTSKIEAAPDETGYELQT